MEPNTTRRAEYVLSEIERYQNDYGTPNGLDIELHPHRAGDFTVIVTAGTDEYQLDITAFHDDLDALHSWLLLVDEAAGVSAEELHEFLQSARDIHNAIEQERESRLYAIANNKFADREMAAKWYIDGNVAA